MHWIGDPNKKTNYFFSELLPVSKFVGDEWINNCSHPYIDRILAKLHLRLFVVPIIVMCFYTIIIWFVSSPSGIGGEIEYYSRLFSNTIFLIITGFFIYRAYRSNLFMYVIEGVFLWSYIIKFIK